MPKNELVEGLELDEYKYDFVDDVKPVFRTRVGLDEDVVREISAQKGEPEWMLEFRLKALKIYESKPMPEWGADLSNLVEMWRKRLPNEWDDQDVWQSVLLWRLIAFERISAMNAKAQLPPNDARMQFVCSEMGWTHNQLAKIARKHKLRSLSERHLQQALRLEPGNRAAADYLAELRAGRN